MNILKVYLGLKILIFTAILSSCSGGFNQKELENAQVGQSSQELFSKVGQPSKLDEVEVWNYGSATSVYLKDGAVQNFFTGFADSENQAFSTLKIGMNSSELTKIFGEPLSKKNIQIAYFKKHQQVIIYQGKIESIQLHLFQDLSVLDKIRLNFNGDSMFVINISLAIIMFGVAIDIRFEHFRQVVKKPKSLLIGIFSQFIALPLLTFVFVYFLQPTPSVAMGMILVAACPGGNISNFMTSFAKGNSALSISLTAIATLAAIFATPLNFSFWGSMYANASNLLVPIEIDSYQMVKTVLILLGLPVIAGLLFRHFFEATAIKISKPLRYFSLVFFVGLIIGAMSLNFEFILSYLHLIALIVFFHNLIALASGYGLAKIFKLPLVDRRTISIETGIQNSGLALVLIFNPKLFDGLGGMAFIAAWWGIWHIISGLTIAFFWNKSKV